MIETVYFSLIRMCMTEKCMERTLRNYFCHANSVGSSLDAWIMSIPGVITARLLNDVRSYPHIAGQAESPSLSQAAIRSRHA